MTVIVSGKTDANPGDSNIGTSSPEVDQLPEIIANDEIVKREDENLENLDTTEDISENRGIDDE